jgi:hypothetical protein
MLKSKIRLLAILCLVLFAVTLPAHAEKKQDKSKKEKKVYSGTPVLWRLPEDIESRNLLLGAGGEAMKPGFDRVTFIEEKSGGWSKKYRVKDADGNEWIAKLSKEAQPEVAANRLLWAIGYFTEIDYLIPRLTVDGKGTFENVRLEARRKEIHRTEEWQWEANPFIGKPELQGLKIMMAFINNWDLKNTNNKIIAVRDPASGESELRYIVSDLGGTFGKTGGFISRSRNKPSDYAKAEFIKAVKGNRIDFNYGGKNQKLFDNVTLEDAKWLAGWLTRLSDEQIKDAFRAANYSTEEVDQLAAAVRARIEALTRVSTTSTAD